LCLKYRQKTLALKGASSIGICILYTFGLHKIFLYEEALQMGEVSKILEVQQENTSLERLIEVK
jgi:hypothetical protein